MDRFFFLLIALSMCLGLLQAQPSSVSLKAFIQEKEHRLREAPDRSKGELFLELSKLYLKDQNQEKAFRIFLEALRFAPTKTSSHSPQDHSLYKMLIAFAPVAQKSEVVKVSLKKNVDENIVIPRTDVGFYVDEAVNVQQFDSAQQLINKAREWYRFSRIINAAQECLDQQKKKV